MIPVTKPHLPEIGRYISYIERCYQNNQLTNNGPLAQELKARLEEVDGRIVVDRLGVHRLDEAEVVDDLAVVGQ